MENHTQCWVSSLNPTCYKIVKRIFNYFFTHFGSPLDACILFTCISQKKGTHLSNISEENP
eukprot:NODE_11718_length_201_cov_1.111842_g11103_i0.p1 GENE.NODE_11718_length_201_cov_1.111842_g11103_i0~~NODE_11718_length_201_cov_1.111842_g11103_i0.p1  ORF type:complete len:61 (-),score=2.47 NODE_11718_length_201_cov_1.111842_g11103_i0:19-201(-)